MGLSTAQAVFQGFQGLQSGFCFAEGFARQGDEVEAVLRSRPSTRPKSKIFFRRGRYWNEVVRFTNKKLVYRMIVIVNGVPPLWISRVFSTGSGVYAPYKPVGCPCMCLVEKLDKNWDLGKSRRFAQSIPVDMQKLIHSA
jgi:hypothetical protein